MTNECLGRPGDIAALCAARLFVQLQWIVDQWDEGRNRPEHNIHETVLQIQSKTSVDRNVWAVMQIELPAQAG